MIALFISFYFLPSIVAAVRRHKRFGDILMMNALLGWTIFWWAGMLAVALEK